MRRGKLIINRILHRLAHWLQWNGCLPDTAWEGSDLVTYLVCSGCGERKRWAVKVSAR